MELSGASGLKGRQGERRERTGSWFSCFLSFSDNFELFNQRVWRRGNFSFVERRVQVNHSLPFAWFCSRKKQNKDLLAL